MARDHRDDGPPGRFLTAAFFCAAVGLLVLFVGASAVWSAASWLWSDALLPVLQTIYAAVTAERS